MDVPNDKQNEKVMIQPSDASLLDANDENIHFLNDWKHVFHLNAHLLTLQWHEDIGKSGFRKLWDVEVT